MREPSHPAAPAFEKASDLEEGQRRQLMAALTPPQREAFDKLGQQHDKAAKELRENQQSHATEQIKDRMRTHLLPQKEPHLRPDSHRHQLKDQQELSYALQDFTAGKKTRVTQKYRQELGQAHDKAQREVSREHQHERSKQQDGQKREKDDFLKEAARERQRISPEFEKAARDPSWHRAFNRAAHKEADHSRDLSHQHKHDLDKTR